jgi:hypothetical protein
MVKPCAGAIFREGGGSEEDIAGLDPRGNFEWGAFWRNSSNIFPVTRFAGSSSYSGPPRRSQRILGGGNGGDKSGPSLHRGGRLYHHDIMPDGDRHVP